MANDYRQEKILLGLSFLEASVEQDENLVEMLIENVGVEELLSSMTAVAAVMTSLATKSNGITTLEAISLARKITLSM